MQRTHKINAHGIFGRMHGLAGERGGFFYFIFDACSTLAMAFLFLRERSSSPSHPSLSCAYLPFYAPFVLSLPCLSITTAAKAQLYILPQFFFYSLRHTTFAFIAFLLPQELWRARGERELGTDGRYMDPARARVRCEAGWSFCCCREAWDGMGWELVNMDGLATFSAIITATTTVLLQISTDYQVQNRKTVQTI